MIGLVLSQRLERENYWCRELCTYYPYGLNDNVCGVGNISKQHGLVVYTLFNRRQRKFRKRNKRRRKIDYDDLTSRLKDCVFMITSLMSLCLILGV